MLELRSVDAGYGDAHVLHGMSLTVNTGEVVTLAGRNGAGKTTLLLDIMGLIRHRGGEIHFDGQRIDGATTAQRAMAGIGFVPDDRGIFATLTVEEHLLLPRTTSDRAWTLSEIYDAFPRLRERRQSTGNKLSGGEQQMLALARVLRMGSKILLCDEPTEGLAPTIVEEIGRLFLRIKEQGISILLVEQNLVFATEVADRHYLVAQGHIERSMTNTEVYEHESELLEYLGV
jgi:branched-chain amino acid transport system ATP-binding protein